jgi:thiamine-phosphate pyrophosphorylase
VEQALRALEEYGKLLAPAVAVELQNLRYRAYTLAKAMVVTADSQRRLQHARLYVLLDSGSSEADFLCRARQLIAAGVDVIQLRDKGLDDRALLARARLLRQILDEMPLKDGADNPVRPLLIMNDRPDIGLLARADGVHVGQDELRVYDVRQAAGAEMLIGVSTHNIEQARQAVLDGANYLGCGPTFPSGTKHFVQFPGLNFLRQVTAEISLPAFAIGGISSKNVAQVVAAGFTRLAVSGAVADLETISPEVAALKAALQPAS